MICEDQEEETEEGEGRGVGGRVRKKITSPSKENKVRALREGAVGGRYPARSASRSYTHGLKHSAPVWGLGVRV